MKIPGSLINDAAWSIDLTDPECQKRLFELADELLSLKDLSIDKLKESSIRGDTPLEFKVAAKLAESRKFLITNKTPLHIGVVFGMWGEQNRLKPKSHENPNGEDSLRVKIRQLKWAVKGTSIKWSLYAVDDGCPYGSGEIASKIAAGLPNKKQLNVIKLADHVPTDKGPLKGLKSADDSQKGGAVILGSFEALKNGVDAVIVTDSDSSVHLGQVGLLIQKAIEKNIGVVLGTRKDPDAVLVKQEDRWGVGIALLRHMQRMIGHTIFSHGILDTQAAFKLYRKDVLKKTLKNPTTYDFSIDTDWILSTIASDEPFEMVPFAFIDSFAESASITQGPMTTWETLLKGLAKQVKKHGLPHNKDMVRVIDEEIHTHEDLDLLINHLPLALENINTSDLGDPAVMSPIDVQDWIRKRKLAN